MALEPGSTTIRALLAKGVTDAASVPATGCFELTAGIWIERLQRYVEKLQTPNGGCEWTDFTSEWSFSMAPLKRPWAVLACRASDDNSDPTKILVRDLPGFDPGSVAPNDPQSALDLFTMFFTKEGNNTYNAVRFFNEMSHGRIDLNDSQVFIVNVNLTKAQLTPPEPLADPHAYVVMVTQAAQTAAIQQGVPLQNFYGIVISSATSMLSMAQGGTIPGGGQSSNLVGWAGMDYRWVRQNGTQIWGQEMGHGFGLGHSRSDGIPIGPDGTTPDYTDRLDVMSTRNADSGPDREYGRRGPGINAWNMRGRNWLDEGRVWHCPDRGFDQTLRLRPLHRKDLEGFLAAELPPLNDTDGFPRYLVEYRKQADWDNGIPRSCILVHRFEGAIAQFGGTYSYVMRGTQGQYNLLAGDRFSPSGDMGPQLSVLEIDDEASAATLRLVLKPMRTDVAPATAGRPDNLFVFAKPPSGGIFFNQAAPGRAFVGWQEMRGRILTDAPVGVGMQNDTLFVFAKNAANEILFNQAAPGGGFVGWQTMAGAITDAAPAAAGRRDDLFVFIKALDGRILFNQAAPGGAFVGWQEVPGGVLTDAPLGVGMQRDTLFVFAKNAAGEILFNQAAPGAAFVGWQTMAGAITDAAPAAAGRHDNLFVFIKALDGRILFNQAAPGGAFVGWQEVPGGLLTDAPLGVGMQSDTLFVFAKGHGGRILFNQAAPGGSFVGWQEVPDTRI